MSLAAKRVLALLLLVVFLIPSTGLILYVHECNMNSSTLYSAGEKEYCCSHTSSDKEIHEHTAPCTGSKVRSGGNNIAELPCCEDSDIFLKLGEVLVSQNNISFDSLLPLYTIFNSIYVPIDDLLSGDVIFDNHHDLPPEIATYLKVSSLRI